MEQNFSEDELEGLLELAGKSDGKIAFDNFMDFLNNDIWYFGKILFYFIYCIF